MQARVEQHDILLRLCLLEVQVIVGEIVIYAKELLDTLPGLSVIFVQVGILELFKLVSLGLGRHCSAQAHHFDACTLYSLPLFLLGLSNCC